MKVTYIHHSSFCVETGGAALVFDYYDGSGVPFCRYCGKMPEYPADTPLYVFSSHSHRDHFDAGTLKWAEQYPNIHYIFAQEAKKKLGREALARLGIAESVREKITYVKPREQLAVGDVRIETLHSTDSGVAFLVEAFGRTIYHAGDLNWWNWEGESEEFQRFQERVYKEQVGLLKGKEIDLAFVVIDPRLGEQKYLGIDYFMQNVRAAHVCPMHLWKHYELAEEYKGRLPGEDREKILVMSRENQEIRI